MKKTMLFKRNSRGLELSVTVLVLLIISIVMFILALTLLKKFFFEAESIRLELDKDVERRIEKILTQGTDVLAAPFTKATLARGVDKVFGIGVRNVLGAQQRFCTYTFFDSAYLPDEREVGKASGTPEYDSGFIQQHWLGDFALLDEPGVLGQGDFRVVPVRIKAFNLMADGQQTLKGTYVFNTCVFTSSQNCSQSVGVCRECADNPLLCGKLRDTRPTNFVYTDRLTKLFIEVS